MVRTATIADLPALLAVIEKAYRGDTARKGWTHEADLLSGQRTDDAALASILSMPDHQILILEIDAAVVGSVHVQSKGAGLAYLGQLAVDPERQASGYGRMLIEAAERLAVDAFGATMMEMTVISQRPELIAYYVRRGYVTTGETRPFPVDDKRFGIPTTRDLSFIVLAKHLRQSSASSDDAQLRTAAVP